MREYEIWRIVDVNMYNSLLSPDFTLERMAENDAQQAKIDALWNRFDFEKYSDFVCERAVIELKKLLKRLPRSMDVRFVEDSAEIYSPPYYNYGGDELIFRIRANTSWPIRGARTFWACFPTPIWRIRPRPVFCSGRRRQTV